MTYPLPPAAPDPSSGRPAQPPTSGQQPPSAAPGAVPSGQPGQPGQPQPAQPGQPQPAQPGQPQPAQPSQPQSGQQPEFQPAQNGQQPAFSGGFSSSDSSAPASASPWLGTPGQGAPGQGAPAQAAGGQPPTSKKRWLPWAIGGCGCLLILAIVAVVLIFVFVINATSGPRSTVEQYEQAWVDGDCEAFFATTTEDFRAEATCDDFESAASEISDFEFEIVETSRSGDSATVSVEETYTYYGDEYEQSGDFHLVKVDGDWLIDSSSVD